MKNFKNIIYFLALSLMMVSCGEDEIDSVTNPGTFTATNQVDVSFTDTNDAQEFFEGNTATYTVTLSSAVSEDITVNFAVTSTDESVTEVDLGSIIIPAGSTSTDLIVSYNDDGVVDSAETYTITITDAVPVPTNTFFISETSTRTAIVSQAPTIVTTTVGNVEINLAWSGSEDLDLYLRDEPGFAGGNPNIDFSWFSQPESMTMNSSLSDGTYYIGVDSFLDTPPFGVACDLTLTFPDGSSEMIISNLDEFIWIQVDKLTNGTEVTYTITQ